METCKINVPLILTQEGQVASITHLRNVARFDTRTLHVNVDEYMPSGFRNGAVKEKKIVGGRTART